MSVGAGIAIAGIAIGLVAAPIWAYCWLLVSIVRTPK
jgi:hypothetical protein